MADATAQKNEHTKETGASTASRYNSAPYDSACRKEAHPDFLFHTARTYGFTPPAFETASVLELGCGIGSNLIPYAMAFPQSTCTGIDLSEKQIGIAHHMSSALKLKNIRFNQMDIRDVGDKLGKFDYIICHGVFSWVPGDIRQKIMEICGRQLTAQGLAVISYNALPGWYFDHALRDAMRFHARDQNGMDKVAKAREFCNFLAAHAYDGTPFRQSYKTFLQTEAKTQESLPDHYLFHDHLAQENRAFYLEEVENMAAEQGLQYAGDAMNHTALPLDSEAQSFLAQIKDPVSREQYSDFITCRRFRLSIFTPAAASKAAPAIKTYEPRIETAKVSDKPRAYAYAQQQVRGNPETPMLTTRNRESVKTTLFMNLLTLYADGRRDIDALAEKMAEHEAAGDISLKTQSGAPLSGTEAKQALHPLIENMLEQMAQNGLLQG